MSKSPLGGAFGVFGNDGLTYPGRIVVLLVMSEPFCCRGAKIQTASDPIRIYRQAVKGPTRGGSDGSTVGIEELSFRRSLLSFDLQQSYSVVNRGTLQVSMGILRESRRQVQASFNGVGDNKMDG